MSDARVKGQYEALPYPPRDPADEARRLISGSPSLLPEVNHYLFGGRRDFAQPFRALVAGGGTGDGLIQLAVRLAATPGAHEVVYLDISSAARAIAEARAAMRGLKNIRFITGSLLDVADLAPGPYDYIESCGVLHHLDDPVAGLKALAAQLAPGGGFGLMLYGAYGRTGVYPMQAALRQLIPDTLPVETQIALAKKVLAELPASNAFQRNPVVQDHRHSDAGLFDLLLHARDRAYSVMQIGLMLERCGLAPVVWIEPCRYDPLNFLKDPELRQAAANLSPLERAALAERLTCTLKSHVFYATRKADLPQAAAQPAPDLVPMLHDLPAAALAATLAKRGGLTIQFPAEQISLAAPPRAADIVARMDGQRSLGAIASALGLGWEDFLALYQPVHAMLTGINKLFLRA